MRTHLLRDLEPAILEIGSDPRGSESIAADLHFDAGGQSPPANHPPHIGAADRRSPESRATACARRPRHKEGGQGSFSVAAS